MMQSCRGQFTDIWLTPGAIWSLLFSLRFEYKQMAKMATQKAREELARQSGFEDLSFATRSYRPEYASTPDIRGSNRREYIQGSI